MEHVNGFLVAIIFLLLVVIIVKFKKVAEERTRAESLRDMVRSKGQQLNDYIDKSNKDKNTIETLNKEVEFLKDFMNARREQDPLKHFKFYMPNGEVARNVKVKAIMKKDKVIGLRATIRQYVDGKSTEVVVAAKYADK